MPARSRDYYQVLGVAREADDKEIKRAFRRLARKYHPDVNPGDKQAEKRFKEISEAYQVLGDPKKRQEYDQYGRVEDLYARSGAGPFTGFSWFGAAGPDSAPSGAGGLEDLLGDLLGRRQGAGARRRGQDLQAEFDLTLEEAYHGVTKQVSVPLRQFCPDCDGAGLVGRGAVCATCGGEGQIEQVKRLEVKVPAGVHTGAKIRLAGQGSAGRGGARGDLLLVARIAPHRLFARRGDDLQVEAPVTFPQAALGAEIEVPTLDGTVKAKLPPGTSSGQQLRLSGKGMPRLRGGGRGDLYAKIKIVVPKHLTEEERKLIAGLRDLRSHRRSGDHQS